MSELIPGYTIRTGGVDRALLLKFMQCTYKELFPEQDFSHLARTVEQYYSKETPLWWVELSNQQESSLSPQTLSRWASPRFANANTPRRQLLQRRIPPQRTGSPSPLIVACLWAGNAIDQVKGDRYTHIFLLYVVPEYRKRGIGTALMKYAEAWAKKRGDRQIGLQVFQCNQPALNLYNQIGYESTSIWMVKELAP